VSAGVAAATGVVDFGTVRRLAHDPSGFLDCGLSVWSSAPVGTAGLMPPVSKESQVGVFYFCDLVS
jgi:hypothetical protein